jgi:class 3 adenylate cyclase/DNA-binding NarL/FixJ family response regulator
VATPSWDDRLDRLQSYLPQHLADKILANRGRLQGERKLVTVLFLDIVSYSVLSKRLGEEALFALMDNLYERFIHDIHRYEGTVNELTGDGIVAFFGAPLAVEQAPLRAVRAALALQQTAVRCSPSIKRAHGLRLQVRVGINTGPVIVGTVGNNLRMDYKAIGDTVNLAARIEQTAEPGTIQITAQTYKLVEGYFHCEGLGPVSVKGAPDAVPVYRVLAEHSVRTRIDVARERGLTRLVARQNELEQLRHCFRLVQNGSGQAVSIIGDAGLGKSRLLYEFRQALASDELTWLEGRCSPYNTAVAYLPITDMLKQHFSLHASDDDADMKHKVEDGLAALNIDLETTAPYLLHLLAPGATDDMPVSMSPEAIKHRIFDTLRLLTLEGAARRPVVLAIEDLHWVDKTTEEFFTFLLDHIAGSRVLLVFTYRPDFVSTWSRKSYHNTITLTRMVHTDSYQMLLALLGMAQVQDALAQLILDKAEGVPFFLEELVKSLQETEAIELRDGVWRLKAETTVLPVPDNVEEVLMARIDCLPEEAKQVLQLGAVIGREISWALLKEVAALPEWELTAHMHTLTNAELLYERGLATQTTYIFKHALTQDAAYRSMLTTRRRELHQRVAVTLEALFPDRLEEHYGQLAYHFCESPQRHELDKAMAYARRAGDRNMALMAYAEAARFYQMALQACEHREPVDDEQRGTLFLALGEAQRKAGDFLQALNTLQCAADVARRLGAAVNLARAALLSEETTWNGNLSTTSVVPLLEEALHGLGEAESALRARTMGSLARALRNMGLHQEATAYAYQAIALGRRIGDPAVLAFNLGAMLALPWTPGEVEERLTYATEMIHMAEEAGDEELLMIAHGMCLTYLLETGDMQGVDAEIEVIDRLAVKVKQPSFLYIITGYRARRALLEGRFADAERLALEALTIGQQVQAATAAGTFGVQMFTLRREQGRLQEVELAVNHFVQQHSAASTWRPGLALIYSELGREEEARAEFESLAQHDFAGLPRDALWVACITYLAEVCVFLQDTARAATLYQLLQPYAGHTVVVGGDVVCYGAASRYLGALAATMARWSEAEQHFAEALVMNARMGASPWLAHTQYQYAVMLLRRNQPGDPAKAVTLLHEALTTARALGMHALAERVNARMHQPAALALLTSGYLDDLSQREIDVLRLIVAGKSNRDIAETLYISLSTVASHVRHILTKTKTANRTEAAAYAMQHGLSPYP